MGADGAKPLGKSLFQKPHIDHMGPGTDMPTPAGAISRSLFKKQSAHEAHGSNFGIPGENKPSLFRKNSLDEMTVRRTEKPVEGLKPAKPEDVKPIKRERAGIGSYEDPADQRRQTRRPKKSGRPGH
jgi:excinuclease ABC subunit B